MRRNISTRKIRKLQRKVYKLLKKDFKSFGVYVAFENASTDLEETDWVDITGRCGFENDTKRDVHFEIKNVGSIKGISFNQHAIIIANELMGLLDQYERPVRVIDKSKK